MKHPVFMISDGTGITVEQLGNSLLSQFEHIEFDKQVLSYVDTPDKAQAIIQKIEQVYQKTQLKPLLFMTLVNPEVSQIIKTAPAVFFDLFHTFIHPLESALGSKSSFKVGRAHGFSDVEAYNHRIEALDYALIHDDGLNTKGYDKAQIILVGVSRSGKTPSCLYMALQFKLLAANYPFTEEDLTFTRLPQVLVPHKKKLFGLSIDPTRLARIRTGRKPGSRYASIEQCQHEVRQMECLFKDENIPFLNATLLSVEEIATKILDIQGIKREM